MSQTHITPQAAPLVDEKFNEQILVVPRAQLFPHDAWHGVKAIDLSHYINVIINHQEFIARGLAEADFSYKQIIPYLIFQHDEKLFLMQRCSKASESRLANKYSLGIGGHVRKEDIQSRDLFEWAQREFHEEVSYTGNLSISTLGILNDDSNDVGKVHLGLVLLLKGDSADIHIKSELKSGALYSFEECKEFYSSMESWSQLAFDFLTE